jgi:hypothetical protein
MGRGRLLLLLAVRVGRDLCRAFSVLKGLNGRKGLGLMGRYRYVVTEIDI